MTEKNLKRRKCFFCLIVSVPHRLPALFWPRGKAETWQNGTVGMEEGTSPHSHAHKEVTEDIKVINILQMLTWGHPYAIFPSAVYLRFVHYQ